MKATVLFGAVRSLGVIAESTMMSSKSSDFCPVGLPHDEHCRPT